MKEIRFNYLVKQGLPI